jgi:hypothetical protein
LKINNLILFVSLEKPNMNLLSVKSLKPEFKDSDLVTNIDDFQQIITQPTKNNILTSEDFDRSFITEIKCEWYHKKVSIYLTDKNEILLAKLAIKQTKKDLKGIIKKINTIETSNEHLVPKRYYDLLAQRFDELAVDLIHLKKDFVDLHSRFIKLNNEQADLITSRDRLCVETERLKSKLTPRPTWSKCSNYFSCGPKIWQSYMNSCSSNELVDILLNEFIGGNDGTNTKHILTPKPIGQILEEKYENMKLSKRDVLLLIHEILNEKYQSHSERESLKNFIYFHLCRKFQLINIALKWYYNLIDSLDRFNYNENVKFFQEILNEKFDENIYHYFKRVSNELNILCNNTIDAVSTNDQASLDDLYSLNGRNSAHSLSELLTRHTSMYSVLNKSDRGSLKQSNYKMAFGKTNLKITEQNLIKILRNKFKDIKVNDLRGLINAAKIDLINKSRKMRLKAAKALFDDLFEDIDVFDLNILFQVDEDGTLTEFLTKLKSFMNKERNNYTLSFLKEILIMKKLVIADNGIKFDNADLIITPEFVDDLRNNNGNIFNSVKTVKKVKKKKKLKDTFKKLKKKIKSGISLSRKSTKKKLKIVDKMNNSNNDDEVGANSIVLEKSSSFDSVSSFNIDIKDGRIYDMLITVDEFKMAILSFDSEISILETQRYIDWVFKSEDIINRTDIKLGRAIRKLQHLNCFIHEPVMIENM